MKELYDPVRNFEEKMAEYTGSPYAVAVDSCTSAIFLCCKYLNVEEIYIPKRTYVSVPNAIMNAGGRVKFDNRKWFGCYKLHPYQVWDCALRLFKGMYINNTFMCLSFHYKKHLPIGRGGMILTHHESAVEWFRRARNSGRNECDLMEDTITQRGWNCYMLPEQAARGLYLLNFLPDKNEDLTCSYPDLSAYLDYLGKPLFY